ncbi:hypothetical protein PsorP6_009715 [Peronosclerospora sorghi]|uniref:Uncharacterized protein n=1 Tax=Peronosclerospora sorghi TaxID=230839 RepID=A0ACC0W2K2_9STRA|nr:hypothetical protein PsorP6_009715 [Peronosclerospora sorghi]
MAPRTRASSAASNRRADSTKEALRRREVSTCRQERSREEDEEVKAESLAADEVVHNEPSPPRPDPVFGKRHETRGGCAPSTTLSDAEDVFSSEYLLKAGRNTSALCHRLKRMWETLQHTASRQQQREEGVLNVSAVEELEHVTADLLQPQFMTHADKTVRSLVACCFVELLRIAAPQSPFRSDDDLYRVFKLFIEQIRALNAEQGTTSSDLHSFYILESLATVKSCVLVVGLTVTMEENEDVMIVQFFQALFDTIKRDHSTKMEHWMLSIMTACLEESDGVDASVLDVIFSPLVGDTSADDRHGTGKSTEKDNSSSNLARTLIQRTSDVLQEPVSTYLNHMLADDADTVSSHKTSKLKEHVYSLIYHVHTINPSLLLFVLPTVCQQLQVDEVATRSDAIAVLGQIFASSQTDDGPQYMKTFRDFLGRFRDASKDIRMQMIRACVPIWEHKPDVASLLENEFVLRLSDPEWEIRQLVVHELCDFAANCLELISEECLRAVGERMKDKKVLLRKETMTGLSQVFSTHVSSYFEELDADDTKPLSLHPRHIPATNFKKLGWIPDYVLKCYAYPQQELQLRVIQLLDDFLLPKAFTERIRANRLLFIFHSLDAASKEALRRIFSDRAKCQRVVKQFVDLKLPQRSKRCATDDNGALEKATQQLYEGLVPLFSDVSGLRKLLERLVQWKDRSLFKHLQALCTVSKSQCDIRHERDQVIRCVGSKTPLGELMKKLCRKLAFLTMNPAVVAVMLDSLVLKKGRPSRENRSIVELMVLVSGEQPELFAPFIREKIPSILVPSQAGPNESPSTTSDTDDEEDTDPRVVLGALNVLSNSSHHYIATARDELPHDKMLSTAVIKQLHKFCLGHGSEAHRLTAAMESRAAELAAIALSHFDGHTEDTKELINALCSKEKLGSPTHPQVAPVLQSLKVFSKRCCHLFTENMALFLRVWSHLLTDLIGKGDEVARPGTARAKESSQKGTKPAATKVAANRCLAINVAVNLIVYDGHLRRSSTVSDEGTELLHLLFEILRSDGTRYASTPSLTALFRAAASCGLLKLVRNRRLEASLSVSEWHLLGRTMQDTNEDVRRAFLKKLTSLLMTRSIQHPHKYLSYLALAATDANPCVKKGARNLLKLGVDRMRRAFDAASVRESEPSQSGSHSPSWRAVMVPEYALPYVIHLLAHHPAFPVHLVNETPSVRILQSPLWSDQLACLGFFLDGLVGEHPAATGNIAFLLQLLAHLSQCHDVTSPDASRMYPLIDSAVVLLKRKIKDQAHLQPFPGKIFLPKHLYSPGRPPSLATPGERKEPEGPDDSLKMPRLSVRLESPCTFHGGRCVLMSTHVCCVFATQASLSPIKPMDYAAHFMKLQSPPGSSLSKRYTKKRKRSLLTSDDAFLEMEEKAEDNEDDGPTESRATLSQC